MEYSLNHYASRNPLNAIIAENMVDVTMLQEGYASFEYIVCFCFSTAYHICQEMIEESHVMLWRLPDYYKIARFQSHNDDLNNVVQAVTLSVVLILTDHFDETWKSKNLKALNKIKDYIQHLYISGETITMPGGTEMARPFGRRPVCAEAYIILKRGTDIDYVIPFEEFSTQRTKDTLEEQEKIIDEKVKAAFDDWQQALSKAKADIESKIPHLEYDAKNEKITVKEAYSQNYGSNVSLEEMIKTTVKKYLDDELEASDADIDEIFADVYGKELVDQVNRELSAENGNEKAKELKQVFQSPMINADENIQQQLDEARKTIEKQTQTLNEQQRMIDDYASKFDPKLKGKDKYHILSGKQHVILYLAVLAHHNRIPNARENLSWELSLIAGRAESYMKRMLKEAITQEECDKTAKLFHETTPFIESLIKELPTKLQGDKSEKNRKKVLKDKQN